ncbi:SRPBCC family protein [Massilia sp. TS11]|uniref:SRPBCC family protein n=1 Tax=Massilia sp. TS11 TaxID=2908003 RepID=UPI001EDB3FE1|nr:SRPBCC family protein [Massilia sp. TS11]MCG2583022.1 SRPBCC family protein [Massilia sp. TS11]
MAGQTIRLQRVFKTTPDKLYRAFITPAAMLKWLPPFGFSGTVHSMDARVGGGYQMSFTNFGTGSSHSFSGEYLELTPGVCIRYINRFDDPGLPGEMLVTVRLQPVICGTEIQIEQAGVPEAIPAAACYLGWQESLIQLGQLVEPDIPG